MRSILSIAALSLCATAGAQPPNPTFVPLGHPNGYFMPAGIAADGATVVGMSYVNPGPFQTPGDFARRWRRSVGFDYPGPSPEPTASWSKACSADGQVMCGGSGHAQFGDLEGWVRVGNSPAHTGSPATHDTSDLLGLSSNGAIAVGYGGMQSNPNLFEAALYQVANDRWTRLGTLPGGGGSQARACSADGSIVVGWSGDPTVLYRTAFRWTAAGGMVAIPHLLGGNEAVATGVSGDGSVVVGEDYVVDANWNSQQTAWLWRAAQGTVALPGLPGGTFCTAFAVSADGVYTVGIADDLGHDVAVIWDDVHGVRRLTDVIRAAGIGDAIVGWELTTATCIAGSNGDWWVAGEAVDPGNYYGAFAVHLGLDAAAATPIGSACGANTTALTCSVPHLGQSLQFMVSGALPLAIAACVVSFPLPAALPIGGGCALYIDVSLGAGPLWSSIDGAGHGGFALPVPASVALTGLGLAGQVLVAPTNGGLGFDLSNGVRLQLGY